jgi:hypothetical protein
MDLSQFTEAFILVFGDLVVTAAVYSVVLAAMVSIIILVNGFLPG